MRAVSGAWVALVLLVAVAPAVQAARVTLAWDPNVEPVDGYRLYYGPGPDLVYTGLDANEGVSPVEIPLSSLSDPQAPTFDLSGLPSCQVHHFAATAYLGAEESDKSESVIATILAKPESVQAMAGLQAGALSISWGAFPADDSGSLAGYRVYYDVDAGEPYEGTGAIQGPSPIALPFGQTSLQLTGLAAGATLYVKVEAYCADGTTSAANEVTGPVGQPVCGNGVLEAGETCDPPASCPQSCSDGIACTSDSSSGSAAACTLSCLHTVISSCISGDGCCPPACNSTNDSDCSQSCGNGIIEPGETCDPPASCPQSCSDGNACTTDEATGSAANCSLSCSHSAITVCISGDGCCPPACNNNNDSDCSQSCGNGIIEPGETCDPPESCPQSCDDGNSCTVDVISGSAAHCSAGCNHTVITACFSGDGCCPAGCDPSVDSDCSQSCGNGIIEPGETCDPPESCPQTCDDGDACTVDQLTGNPLACSAGCSHNRITACESGDGCCPPACVGGSDSDCYAGPGGDPNGAPPDPSDDPAGLGAPGTGQTLVGGCSVGGADAGFGIGVMLGLLALLCRRRWR